MIGEPHFLADVHEQETACTKTAFHFARFETSLTKQRGLLVNQAARAMEEICHPRNPSHQCSQQMATIRGRIVRVASNKATIHHPNRGN